jgi:S1-C subfamily serine protease
MRRSIVIVAALVPMAAVALAGQALASAVPKDAQQVVDEATFLFRPPRCAGVIVGDRRHALTAAHCIPRKTWRMNVELFDGTIIGARVKHLERKRDVAVLRLERAAPVRPLELASRLPALGDALYFGGRPDRPNGEQVLAVLKLGRCPSLPRVPKAIFTNLRARKGDSGAPLVNRSLEVVGLVHGGARCNVAAPTVGYDDKLGLPDDDGPADCVWGSC